MLDLAAALVQLRRTPQVLRALVEDLPDELLHANEGEGTWSPYEVVGHLIHGERTDWIPRARIILSQGTDRRFAPFDREAQQRLGRSIPVGTLLDAFATERAANLATLESFRLTPVHLALTGEHPELGTVTLEELLATWVAHDHGHVLQVARVLARRYRDAVGPWRAYLSVLAP